MYKDILLSVSRPSRYIGQEINSIKKDLSKVRAKVALVFPDTYEIGMSHLGLKILYHILNRMEDVAAERAFVPWGDLEEVLTKRGEPLVSLESSLPLMEFNILGFTLPYELCYSNVLTTLALSGIPLRSAERDEQYPLVIGGGTAVFNPEPVADFFDAFFLGDGEAGVVDIIHAFNTWKEGGGSKESLLLELSRIEGIYIPSFYTPQYHPDGALHAIQAREGIKEEVKKRIVEDLDKAPYPTSTPIPYMQAIHDRLTIEVARGCTHGCRFCQAGMTYRPVRERSPEKILEIIDASLKNTGYEEVSLSSLSTGDFACLSSLLTSLVGRHGSEHVAFSLPSLRVGTLTPAIIDQVTDSKNTSFTIAPEAGTERLRKVINKEMDEGVFLTTIDDVFRKGVKSVKLYFMIGLPTEDTEDLEGIISLAKRARDTGNRYGKGGRDITVSVSTFVPKAHTPFQWYGQTTKGEIEQKIEYLKNGLKKMRVSFKWHRTEMSYLEAVFSRGDRRLGKVIEAAWRAGCRFDSWTERLNLQRWKEAFDQCSINPDFYALRHIPLDETLPWEHLSAGVTKDFLIREYQRAAAGRLIPDCRYGSCPICGVCDMEAVRGERPDGIRPIARKAEEKSEVRSQKQEVRSSKTHPVKYRIRYSKTGDLRMLSQLEIMNTFMRALKRAQMPTAFSEGFHPHPKISFGPALPVGMESICEYMDVEFTRPFPPDQFKDPMNRCLPEGIKVLHAEEIPYHTPSLNSSILFYAYEIQLSGIEISSLQETFQLSNLGELWSRRVVEKDGRKILREINARPFIEDIRWMEKDLLFLLLRSKGGECCRPSDVLSALFKVAPDDPRVRIRRTGLYGKEMDAPHYTKNMEKTCLQKSS